MASDFTVERNSSKWVLGADGYLKEYIADAAAIEFNADGSYKGVLVEPASTNFLTYSDFDAANPTNWTVVFGTGTYNYALTTFQGKPALEHSQTVSGRSPIQQSVTFTASTTYTCSIKVDVANSSGVGDNVVIAGVYNLSDVTGDYEVTYGEIDSDGRATFTFTTGADTSGDIRIGLGTSGAQTGILVFGQPQLEASPIATSYIPTTTAAVTRVKDDIYLTSASSLIGQTEGTLFIEVDWQETDGSNQYLLALSDGTVDNRIAIVKDDGNSELRMLIESNNVLEVYQGESYSTYSGIQKFAMAYAQNDVELYRNGSSISTDTSADLSSLATLDEIDFANRDFGLGAGNQANMWIRAVALFTTRLSDAECEALTTL